MSRHRARRRARAGTAVAALSVVALLLMAGMFVIPLVDPVATRALAPRPDVAQTPERALAVAAAAVEPASPEVIAALPEARYDAVIPALDATAPPRALPTLIVELTRDVALYGHDRRAPVARLAARNFLGDATVVAAFPAGPGGWQLVLTPARRTLPSAPGSASAQSSAWVRSADLGAGTPVAHRVEIAVGAGRLSIEGPGARASFDIGVGAASTPTPVGVVGYLQARYLDPAQGQARHRIQLTSLHATADDEPFGGADGGLIGIHHGSGSSHGCVRVEAAALAALDELPLGTPVRIVE